MFLNGSIFQESGKSWFLDRGFMPFLSLLGALVTSRLCHGLDVKHLAQGMNLALCHR